MSDTESKKPQRVEVITSVQRRRRWSVAEKIHSCSHHLKPDPDCQSQRRQQLRFNIRKFLISTADYAELQPSQFYEQLN